VKRKTKINLIMFSIFAATAFLFGGGLAMAYQVCQPNSDCVLGEFLYDDSYDKVTDKACEITINNPEGERIVNDEDMPYADDGWHYYVFNSSGPEGFYRASMCCKHDGDKICSDKSFVLESKSVSSVSKVSETVSEESSSHDSSGETNIVNSEKAVEVDDSVPAMTFGKEKEYSQSNSISELDSKTKTVPAQDSNSGQLIWTVLKVVGALVVIFLVIAIFRNFRQKRDLP
jgi:hypothetical protein